MGIVAEAMPLQRGRRNASVDSVFRRFRKTDVGIIPEDWRLRSLAELGQSLIGLTYDPKDIDSGGVLVLRSSNIGNNCLKFGDEVYVKMRIPDRLIIRENDLLICVRNGSRPLIGKCALTNGQAIGMTFGAFMSVFRSYDSRFVFHCFQSDIIKRQIRRHLGATINQITNKSLNSFRIPYPERKERHAIVETLSDVDAFISELDSLISKKRVIKQAIMRHLLTGETRLSGFNGEWQTTSMGRIGSTYNGLAGKSKADFGAGEAQYLTFLSVLDNVILDRTHSSNVHVASSESQNTVLEGDLLFNGTSETPDELAMGAVMGEQIDNLYLNSFCFGFRIRNENSCDPLFLAYFFRSLRGRAIMRALAQGATRYNMSKLQFLDLEISIPPFREQCAIATVLSEMDAEISALERQVEKVRAIKQGMMQDLLTGRVRLVETEG